MEVITVILLLTAALLAARLFFIRREIGRITEGLRGLDPGNGRCGLRIAILYSPLEILCEEMNLWFQAFDKSRVNAENQELELRGHIANLSHDLRTPLTSILGYMSMIKTVPEKRATYLDIIEGRAKNLQGLVEQYYELSVADGTHSTLELAEVNVTDILTESLLGNYPLFKSKGIKLETNLPPHAVTVWSNKEAAERIFQNLIQNALKFSRREIRISLSDTENKAVMTISNDAESLSGTDIAHIFERFYTADRARSKGNTGLGLYIVKRLLEKTGGGIAGAKLEDGWFTLEIYMIIFAHFDIRFQKNADTPLGVASINSPYRGQTQTTP